MGIRTFLTVMMMALPVQLLADTERTIEPLPAEFTIRMRTPWHRRKSKRRAPTSYGLPWKSHDEKRQATKREVTNAPVALPGERNTISIFLDGKPFGKDDPSGPAVLSRSPR